MMIAEIRFWRMMITEGVSWNDWSKRYPEMVRGCEVLSNVSET